MLRPDSPHEFCRHARDQQIIMVPSHAWNDRLLAPLSSEAMNLEASFH